MSETREPTPLEERHFVELVTYFRNRQRNTGKNLTRQLRAELKRFGYIAIEGGLRVVMEEDDMEVDDDAIDEYLALINRLVLVPRHTL